MNARQPEPTFFVDQNLCGLFAAHLRLAGLRIEELQDHFPPGTRDVDWLPFVGEKGWVAVTMDHLKSDPEEQVALMVHGVRVFVLVGKRTHQEHADFFLRKLRWVRRTLAAHLDPFLARLYIASGDHKLTTLADFMDAQARRRH
ncbi:MAG TPA: hypothetical protein VGR07_05350 [Thermoanaerobaculia bacterium]|jgi:hypothetical protein|nr:hypothetical protein [Thermoanaerobaculia bacterium]